MDKAIRSTNPKIQFVDERATTKTIGFVSKDYTVADIGDIKRYLGVENPEELKKRMKERLDAIDSSDGVLTKKLTLE